MDYKYLLVSSGKFLLIHSCSLSISIYLSLSLSLHPIQTLLLFYFCFIFVNGLLHTVSWCINGTKIQSWKLSTRRMNKQTWKIEEKGKENNNSSRGSSSRSTSVIVVEAATTTNNNVFLLVDGFVADVSERERENLVACAKHQFLSYLFSLYDVIPTAHVSMCVTSIFGVFVRAIWVCMCVRERH